MTRHLLTAAALGAAAFFAFAPSAHDLRLSPAARTPSALIETEAVEAPYAYRRLCAEAPEICPATHAAQALAPIEAAMEKAYGSDALRPASVVMTEERRRQLDRVNSVVNAAIEPRVDVGGDVWSLGFQFGDCEEYVLAKRELLIRLGWPRSALRITVVHDGIGYHAVLVVATDAGEFVLDNLVGYVSRVENSPYEFIVAESLDRPGAWVRIVRAEP